MHDEQQSSLNNAQIHCRSMRCVLLRWVTETRSLNCVWEKQWPLWEDNRNSWSMSTCLQRSVTTCIVNAYRCHSRERLGKKRTRMCPGVSQVVRGATPRGCIWATHMSPLQRELATLCSRMSEKLCNDFCQLTAPEHEFYDVRPDWRQTAQLRDTNPA